MKVILTEEQVLKAINHFCKHRYEGLCVCFRDVVIGSHADSDWMYDFLKSLGGGARGSYYSENGAHFWPLDEQGRNDRAMFLAFMLEWARQ